MTRTTASSAGMLTISLAICTTLLAPGCDESSEAPIVTAPSSTVGPEGGTITDAGGASVTIPAGALSGETAISVETVHEVSQLPFPVGANTSFAGAARFEPDGLTFQSPVRISIPLTQAMTPNSEVALFVYDETLPGWRSETQAVVSADGQRAIADVTHFSIYILMGDAHFWFGIFRRDFFDICDPTPSEQLYQETFDLISEAFRTGTRDVHDFGAHDANFGYGCYEIVGVSFVLSLARAVPDESQQGQWISVEERVFDDQASEGDINLAFVDQQERVISSSECGEFRLSYQWGVTVGLECRAPALTIETDDGSVIAGTETTLRASLLCGSTPFEGQEVSFEVEPGVGVGHVTPETAITDVLGSAATLLTTDLCLVGDRQTTATIRVDYEACVTQGSPQTAESTVDVEIEELLTGDWLVAMQSTTSDCDPIDPVDPPWTARVIQDGNTIYVDAFTGQVNGNTVSWIVGYPEDEGWTTERCTGTISADGGRIDLHCSWDYVDSIDPENNCSGEDFTIVTKQCP